MPDEVKLDEVCTAEDLVRAAADELNLAFIQLDNDRITRAWQSIDAALSVLTKLESHRPPK